MWLLRKFLAYLFLNGHFISRARVGSHVYTVNIPWGDCDPAGIVYYPNFFAYLDQSSWSLFIAAGLTLAVMEREYGTIGIPVADAQATFLRPCRFGDRLRIETRIAEWKERVFTVEHVVQLAGQEAQGPALTAKEVRFWGIRHPDDPQRLKTAPIPAAVIEKLRGLAAAP